MNTYLFERPSDLGKLVVIGGPGGTGSSTIAKLLARKWQLHRVDAGEIMRNKTEDSKLSQYLQDRVTKNPEIDHSIDQFLVRMSYYPNILIEGKYFAAIATSMGIPCTLKMWITADLPTRISRILLREGHMKEGQKLDKESKMYKKTRDKLMKRQSNDQKRCLHLYHVDVSNPAQFNDLIIDTTSLNVSYTLEKIYSEINDHDSLKKRFPPDKLK